MTKTRLVGLILAAGRGARFDPTGAANKLCARLPDGRRVIEATLDVAEAALDEIAVVVGHQESPVCALALARGVRVVANPGAHTGMGTSVAAGVQAYPEAQGWLVLLGDMPFVLPSTVKAVALRLSRADRPIVVPTCGGQRGHPVGFAATLFSELAALTGDQGARHLFDRYPVDRLALDDSGILRDVDTPSDLQRLR